MKFYLLLILINSLFNINLNGDCYEDITNSKGVIIYHYDENNLPQIKFYNDDGTLWDELKMQPDGKYSIKKINPFLFDIDDFSLILKVAAENDSMYKVVIDETKGLKKSVKKDNFIFTTWENLILEDAVGIEFNMQLNPLRSTISPSSEILNVNSKDVFIYKPVEIREDYLKVEIEYLDEEQPKSIRNGWIRWKNENCLFVNLIFDM